MRRDQRVVVQLPLDEIWNTHGRVSAKRFRYLTKSEIIGLCKHERVDFIFVSVGATLNWEIYSIKDRQLHDVLKHIVEDPDGFYLEDYPKNMAYVASEWNDETHSSLVVLEEYH